jgi:hypothetical protein
VGHRQDGAGFRLRCTNATPGVSEGQHAFQIQARNRLRSR